MWKGKIWRHCYFSLTNSNNKNIGYSLFPASKGVGGKTEISHFQFLLHIFIFFFFLLHIFKDRGKLLQIFIHGRSKCIAFALKVMMASEVVSTQ